MFANSETGQRCRVRPNRVPVALVLTWMLAVPVVGRAQGVYEVVAAFERRELSHGLYRPPGLIRETMGASTAPHREAGSSIPEQSSGWTPRDLTTLHAFNGCDGAYPGSRLLQAADGNLYGTASQGGPGGGVVFRLRWAARAHGDHRKG